MNPFIVTFRRFLLLCRYSLLVNLSAMRIKIAKKLLVQLNVHKSVNYRLLTVSIIQIQRWLRYRSLRVGKKAGHQDGGAVLPDQG